jgi:uridylate kinase
MEKGRVVIFAAGTGNPFVTTDTGAALRAAEVRAEALLKATKVDGVYTADPVLDPTATRMDSVSYEDAIDRRLKVMDVSAVDLCQRNKIPIVVFDLKKPGNMRAVVEGQKVGTVIGAFGRTATQPALQNQA